MSSKVEPSGFESFRTDRDFNITGMTRGGGVCLLVRDEWCRAVTMRERLCATDIEPMCYYLPREFPQIFITVVYIQPKANFSKVQEAIYNLSQRLVSISPNAHKFRLGDFNNCNVKKSLCSYYQYVDCPTTEKRL